MVDAVVAAVAVVAVAEVVPYVEPMVDGTVVAVELVPLVHYMGTAAVPYDFPSGYPSSFGLVLVALDVALELVVPKEQQEYDVVALFAADPLPSAAWPESNCGVPYGPFPKTSEGTVLVPAAEILLEPHASCCGVAIVAVVVVQMAFDGHRPFGVLPSCCCSAGIRNLVVVGNGSSVVVVVVGLAHRVEPCSGFSFF